MIIPPNNFFEWFKKTPGAFGVAESIALANIAMQVPEGKGNFIECGSNAGKSGMSAAFGLPAGNFYMIDPIYDLSNLEAWQHTIQEHPDNMKWGYVNEPKFKDNVRGRIIFASNARVNPILLGSYSEKELPLWGDYSYAFIDSDNHQHERVFAEIAILEDRMVKGGIICFHDFNNQYIAPQEAHKALIATSKYEDVPIDWDTIFKHVRDNKMEEGNDSWHTAGSEEFPKFVGAVRRK